MSRERGGIPPKEAQGFSAPAEKPEFLVGVTKDKKGNPDYSRAARPIRSKEARVKREAPQPPPRKSPEKPLTPFERREAELTQLVMDNGGFRAATALPKKYHPEGSAGFTVKRDERTMNLRRDYTEVQLAFSTIQEGQDSSFRDTLKRHQLNEALTMIPVTKDVFEEVEPPAPKGILGGLFKKTAKPEKRKAGEEPVQHQKMVKNGSEEPLHRIMYYAQGTDPTRESELGAYKCYDGRNGNFLSGEMDLPKSVAEQVYAQIEENPRFARELMEKIMIEKMEITPEAWESGDENTNNIPLKPPYEEWDKQKERSKMYIKSPNAEPGFNPKSVVHV